MTTEDEKKHYEKPELTVYGDVRQITQDGKSGEKSDGDGSYWDDQN